MPHKTFPVRRFAITQCLSCPTFASHNSTLGNAQNCSWSILMTNKDSLSHATCKRPDTVLSNLRNQALSPNCASGFLHLHPILLSSLVFPFLPILILFMTCAAKRGSQLSTGLSSAIRTPVLCPAEILSVLHCRSLSHKHFHTTVGHVITFKWALWNYFHSNTCVNHRVLKCFRTRLIIAFQNDSAKTKIFDEPTRNEMEYAVGPFRSQHVVPV